MKQVVGYEYNETTGVNEERYYTEVKLTFEVQGEIGVLANESYRLTGGEEVTTTSGKQRVFKINNDKIESDFIRFPFILLHLLFLILFFI